MTNIHNFIFSTLSHVLQYPHCHLLTSVSCLGAGAEPARAATEAGGLPVPVGEPGGRAGEGREGAERPGGTTDPGARGGREGQESNPAGAQRANSAPQGGAQLCESHVCGA